jgi:uncharacterized protein YjbI with pentapeptide repeats
MSDPTQPTNGEPSPHIEKLLDAANSASQTVAALHVAFMAFATYLGVIVWGTTDEDLLRISPVKLPILDTELPLTTFYGFVPWLMILLHFNLLIQLELLSRKLWNLDKDLPDSQAGQQVRDRLFIFPFTHLIAGRSSVRLIRWLLSLAVNITVIVLPLFMLLVAQIRFLPYHDEVITWWQRGAVWADVVMLFFLWPLIVSPNDDMWERWSKLWIRLLGYLAYLHNWVIRGWNRLRRLLLHYWPGLNLSETATRPMPQTGGVSGSIVFLATLLLAFLFSIVAVIPGNMTVQTYYYPTKESTKDKAHFESWLIRQVFKSWLTVVDVTVDDTVCTSLIPKPPCALADPKQRIKLGGIFEWFNLDWISRNLDLSETQLVPKAVTISLLTRAVDPDKSVRDEAFKQFDGLKLQGRDLRFADLSESALPKADLRNVNLQSAYMTLANLQGANLVGTRLQGVNLEGAKLQGADLLGAYLQDADLVATKLQGAHLVYAKLQHADLSHADLQDADLTDANLQGTDLRYANLQGAHFGYAHLQGGKLSDAILQGVDLRHANLQDADLTDANLQGTDLSDAHLQGAHLNDAHLQGAHLRVANLQGTDLIDANLQGSDLRGAKLQGADLTDANLQGTDLRGAKLQGADLSGANLQGANLKDAKLQGIDWSDATLDGIFMVDNLKPYWNDSQREKLKLEELKLEATLKPLLNKKRFLQFQQRMERVINQMPPSGKPSSLKDCYSNDPALLECAYQRPAQLDAYRSTLHSTLIEQACSDAAIAEGIARRVGSNTTNDEPNFNLAAALLKALNAPKPCAGLAALTEQTRQQLREAAKQQEIAS